MAATAESAVFFAGAGATGHVVGAPVSKRTDGVLDDPQPHTRALQARGNARRAAYTGAGASDPIRRTPPPSPVTVKDEAGYVLPHASALAARQASLTGAALPPPPELKVCKCGQHRIAVGLANQYAARKHAAQLTKIEALRAAGPAGPRSR